MANVSCVVGLRGVLRRPIRLRKVINVNDKKPTRFFLEEWSPDLGQGEVSSRKQSRGTTEELVNPYNDLDVNQLGCDLNHSRAASLTILQDCAYSRWP